MEEKTQSEKRKERIIIVLTLTCLLLMASFLAFALWAYNRPLVYTTQSPAARLLSKVSPSEDANSSVSDNVLLTAVVLNEGDNTTITINLKGVERDELLKFARTLG